MLGAKAKQKAPSLKERIDALHAEIDAMIAELAAEIKQTAENQPLTVIEGMLRRGQCRCECAKRLSDGEN